MNAAWLASVALANCIAFIGNGALIANSRAGFAGFIGPQGAGNRGKPKELIRR